MPGLGCSPLSEGLFGTTPVICAGHIEGPEPDRMMGVVGAARIDKNGLLMRCRRPVDGARLASAAIGRAAWNAAMAEGK
jgi:hypothetical protein